jgi:hypothetical protein
MPELHEHGSTYGDPWRCPFCGQGVPAGCTHSCPSSSALPYIDSTPPRPVGGFSPPPPTRAEVERMIPKGLTEEDVRRIVREELAAASHRDPSTGERS